MTKISRLHDRWLKDPKYRAAYETLGPEFELASELIAARNRAKLTQAQLAKRMGIAQSAVARIESGRHWPSRRTLDRYAKATKTRAVIKLVAAE